MPKITAIRGQQSNPDRFNVFIDGHYCCSVRKRTFMKMGLSEGDEISCDELLTREKFFWKLAYGEAAWTKEKVRIEKVKNWLEQELPQLLIEVVGFGASSTALIPEHPKEAGEPDLKLSRRGEPECPLLFVEVSGTETMRGSDYWVRCDKVQHVQNHPEKDIWIVLHFQNPVEKMVVVKPTPGKEYSRVEKEINGAIEYYCIFRDGGEEVVSPSQFIQQLRLLL